MADNSRIDDLRRRVQKDPASIAFAQLAEECRRAGEHQEAADICRSGLDIHPGYLSARVTLGRALLDLGQLEEAQVELLRVLESAPENLAAIRGLAEICHQRGDLNQALTHYRAALLLARNDPALEETIADLSHRIEPAAPASSGGLTLEHMQHELLKHAASPQQLLQGAQTSGFSAISADSAVDVGPPAEPPPPLESPQSPPSTQSSVSSALSASSAVDAGPAPSWAAAAFATAAGPVGGTLDQGPDDRATRTVAALEEWLAAIHVARARRTA